MQNLAKYVLNNFLAGFFLTQKTGQYSAERAPFWMQAYAIN